MQVSGAHSLRSPPPPPAPPPSAAPGILSRPEMRPLGLRANEGELRPLLAESGKAPVGPSDGGRAPGLAVALPNSPHAGQKPEMPAEVIGK